MLNKRNVGFVDWIIPPESSGQAQVSLGLIATSFSLTRGSVGIRSSAAVVAFSISGSWVITVTEVSHL